MSDAPTIIEFVTDPQLLNLSVSSAQRTLLKSLYGLPLTSEEHDLWTQCTGRTTYPGRPFREATIISGARGGKDSRILAPVLAYEALFGGHEQALAKGEHGIIPLVAQDQRATKIAFGYLRAYLTGSPLLISRVEDVLALEIKLTNRLSIVCFPCTHTSLRGWSNPCGGMDELAFYRFEGQADSDVEVQASIRRGMLSFPNPKLIKITTPYMKSGIVYDDFKRYYGHEEAEVLVWRASSLLMNPGLKAERLAQEQRLDPSRYRREYEAEFEDNLTGFLPAMVIDLARVPGRHELPPVPGGVYTATVDTAGGSTNPNADTFTCTIVHTEGTGEHQRVVQDVLKGWKGADLEGPVKEIAGLCQRYGLREVTGDRYAAGWVRQAFEREGIRYRDAAMDKSTAYLEAEPLFTQGRLRLLDHPTLLRELALLERRPRPQGRVLVDHPHGGHDDYANVTCLAIALLVKGQPASLAFYSGGQWIGAPVVAALRQAVTATTQALTSTPSTRSISEIESLSEGCRTPQEQQQLDDHYAKQKRTRVPSDFEQYLEAGHVYWPGDDTRSEFTTLMEQIHAKFSRWR